MSKKIKKYFLIRVRTIYENKHRIKGSDLEKDGAGRKKQRTRSLYLNVLVTCCFPHYTVFLCTSGIEERISSPCV